MVRRTVCLAVGALCLMGYADTFNSGGTNQIVTSGTGTKVVIGQSATTPAIPERLYVKAGNILLDNNYYIKQKDGGGTARNILGAYYSNNNNFLSLGNSIFTVTAVTGQSVGIGSNTSTIIVTDSYINLTVGSISPKIMLYSTGIDIVAPSSKLTLNSSGILGTGVIRAQDNSSCAKAFMRGYNGEVYLGADGSVPVYIGNDPNWCAIAITENGTVGIGTNLPGIYKLAVEGKIGAREIVVTQAAWADHVFKPDYNLKPLIDVEKYIKTNKHLEGIPTEKQVKTNGIPVGEMQAKLLQKVEELTLYMIELKKENTILQDKVKNLERNSR